jgi:hypothetical protein
VTVPITIEEFFDSMAGILTRAIKAEARVRELEAELAKLTTLTTESIELPKE